jgi:hypothetical protein
MHALGTRAEVRSCSNGEEELVDQQDSLRERSSASSQNESGEGADRHKAQFGDELILALRDIGVLLEYFGREPDARLQGCFSDTRQSKGQVNVLVKPPSKTYSEFLNRIYKIQTQYDIRVNSRMKIQTRA